MKIKSTATTPLIEENRDDGDKKVIILPADNPQSHDNSSKEDSSEQECADGVGSRHESSFCPGLYLES